MKYDWSSKFCNSQTILTCWLNCVTNLEVNCFLPHYCSTCTFLRIMGDFLLRPTLSSRPNFGLHWGQPKKGFLLPESIIYISFFYMRVLCHNVSMLQQRNFFPYFFNGSNHLLQKQNDLVLIFFHSDNTFNHIYLSNSNVFLGST